MSGDGEWLTIDELSAEIRVPVSTIYGWRSRGEGPRGHKWGRHVRFARSDVQEWIAGHADDARPGARHG